MKTRSCLVRTEPLPQTRRAWLLEVARRLRADYEALLERVPPRFADIERARLTWIKAEVRELFYWVNPSARRTS
jgi:hypothetical protein